MERKTGIFGIADFMAEQRRKRPNFLDAVTLMIKWQRVERLLAKKLDRNEANAAGNQSYPALVMFKILLLQAWFNLSDEAMEFALHDRISFTRFTGFSLEDETPDHSTICRFRNLLVQKKIFQKLLNEINKQLIQQGKIVKTGCAVDATIITSASRPRKTLDTELVVEDRKEESDQDLDKKAESLNLDTKVSYSKDTEASWTKKANKFHYGYKIHAATDIENGFILSAHATPANKSDTGEFAQVIDAAKLPESLRIFADKGYTSKKNSEILKKRKFKNGIMSKASRNRELSLIEKRRNRLISGTRNIIERSFGSLKRIYGLSRASYLGQAKVEAEFILCSIAFNLKKAVFLLPSLG